MNNPLEIIGAAMRAEADALRLASVNVANAETPAYRRQVAVTQSVQFADAMSAATQAASLGQLPTPTSSIDLDLRPGTLKSTNDPLHLALDGPGFFVLQQPTDSGELLLTRRGDLHVSVDGTLVASTGEPLLGRQGSIHVGTIMPTIAADGAVRIDNQTIDELRIVNVVDGAKLQPVGDGTYRISSAAAVEGERTTSVRQGFLETSNVVPANEVIQLMETVRRFESEQRFARAYDDMLGKAINELGKVR